MLSSLLLVETGGFAWPKQGVDLVANQIAPDEVVERAASSSGTTARGGEWSALQIQRVIGQ